MRRNRAIRAEGALHVDDLIDRRTRIGYEYADHGADALDEVAAIAQTELGWSETQVDRELGHCRAAAQAYESALREEDDAAAVQVRLQVEDLVPLHRT